MYQVRLNGRVIREVPTSYDAYRIADEVEAIRPDARVTVTEDKGPRYHINTYADGYGLWHAIVRDPAHDTSTRLTDKQVRNMREAGKRAIMRELYEREESPTRTRADIVTRVRIVWEDSRQWGKRAYVGSPDTLHIVETPRSL